MGTIVVVHGAFGGGWEWTPVARLLRGVGHEVWTPTLTGLGDRAHLASPDTGLATHVQDLVSLLHLEDLRDVVLCGASYGGMPVTGAADSEPERVRGIVYVDALVPRDGQAAVDLLPAAWAQRVRRRDGDKQDFRVPVPAGVLPPQGTIQPDDWGRYVERLVPQPSQTFVQPIRLTGAAERLPRAFVRCTNSVLEDDPIEAMAARARREGWAYREFAAPHDPHLFNPQGTANILDELAQTLL